MSYIEQILDATASVCVRICVCVYVYIYIYIYIYIYNYVNIFLGLQISDRFAKQISQTVQRCYFSANVWVVFNTKPILISYP